MGKIKLVFENGKPEYRGTIYNRDVANTLDEYKPAASKATFEKPKTYWKAVEQYSNPELTSWLDKDADLTSLRYAITGGAKDWSSGFVNAVGIGSDIGSEAAKGMGGSDTKRARDLWTLMRNAETIQEKERLNNEFNALTGVNNLSSGGTRTITNSDLLKESANVAYQKADTLQEQAQKELQIARDAADTPLGKIMVDTGVAAGQMGADMLASLLTGGVALIPMGIRSFGAGAQQARLQGASLGESFFRGAGQALLSTAVEKFANFAAPLKKAYGSGVVDDAINKLIPRLTKSTAGRMVLSAISEGGEELVEGILSPLLDPRSEYSKAMAAMGNPDAGINNYSPYDVEAAEKAIAETLSDAMYQSLIGFTLGGAGGAVNVNAGKATSAPAETQTAQNRGSNTPQTETAPEAAVNAVQSAEQLDPLLELMQGATLTNRQVETIAKDPQALQEIGIDPNGKTSSQLRAEVRAVQARSKAQQTADPLVQAPQSSNDALVRDVVQRAQENRAQNEVEGNVNGTEAGSTGIVGNQQRPDGLAASEQGGVVAAGTGTASAGRSGGAQAQRAAEIRAAAEAGGAVSQSAAELGLASGTNSKTARALTDAMLPEDLQALKQEQAAKGRDVVFFVGQLELQEEGDVFYARGAISEDGSRIYVRADHPTLTAEQIIRHEEYHAAAKRDPTLNARLKEQLSQREGWLDYLTEAYAALYFTDENGNVTVDADYILEEILADAYAGIDVLAGMETSPVRTTDATAEVQTAVQQAAAKENTAQTDGGERYLLDADFAAQFDAWMKSKTEDQRKTDGGHFRIGTTSKALKDIGVRDRNIYWRKQKIGYIMSDHPEITTDVIKAVPDIIENPVVVMKSQTRDDSIVLFGNLTAENREPVMAAVELTPRQAGGLEAEFSLVTSAYGRSKGSVRNLINSSEILYLDPNKNRTEAWLMSLRVQFPSDQPVLGSIGNITYQDGKVKIKGVRFSDIVQNAQTKNDGERASREADPLSVLERENASLRSRAERLRRETRRTKAPELRQKDVDKLARQIVKAYDSNLPAEEISAELKALGEYLLRPQSDAFSWQAVKDRAANIARKIIGEASVLTNAEAINEFRAIRDYLKNTRIAFQDKSEIPDYADFRRRNFGRFTIAKNGTPVDVLWGELQERFGEGYFPSDITHPADQLLHIAELFDQMEPVYENPYSYFMAEATEYTANDIIDRMFEADLRTLPPTFADRRAAELEAEKQRAKQAESDAFLAGQMAQGRRMAAQQRKAEERTEAALVRRDEIIKENQQRAKQALKKVRADRDAKIAALKENQKAKDARRRERQKARELRSKITRHVSALATKLLHPNNVKNIPEALRGPVARLLEAINTESKYEMEFGKDGEFHRVKAGESAHPWPSARTEAFKALQSACKEIRGELALDPNLMGDDYTDGLFDEVIAMANKRIADMTSAELTTVWQTIRAVENAIYTANKLFHAERWKTPEAAATAIRNENDGKAAVSEYKSFLSTVQRLLNLDMLTPETFFHRLGKSGDTIFRMMRDAQDKYTVMIRDISQFTEKALKGVKVRRLERELHTVKLGGEDVYLSTAQIMELYALMQREAAREHILTGGILPDAIDGRGLKKITRNRPVRPTVEDLNAAFSLLSAEQVKLAETLQEYASTKLSKYGNDASMEVYNIKKFTDPVYWPMRVNRSEIGRRTQENDTQITSVANKGFTKAVKPNAKTSLRIGSIFDTFSTHASEMATYAAWLATTEDINRIRNFVFKDAFGNPNGSVEAILNNVHGKGGADYLSKLLSDIAVGIKGTHAETEYMSSAAGNYKAASVGANLRVIVQQPTAILRAMDMLSPKWFMNAGNPISGWKKAKKYAPIAQWKDWGYFDINTGRQIKDVLFDSDSPLQRVRSAAMWGAGAMDSLSWGLLWNAVEAETKAKHSDLTPDTDAFYEKVKERFSKIIAHTQVVDGILQRSQIMRSSSGLTKMATSFMAEPTKQYNMLVGAAYDAAKASTPEAKQAARRHLARTAATLTVAAVVNAVAQSVMDAVRDDDKDKDYWDKLLSAFTGITGEEEDTGEEIKNAVLEGNLGSAFNPLSYIPFARDFLSLLQGYDISRMDMDGVASTIKAAENLMKALEGKGKYNVAGALTNLIGEASRLLGVPVANLKREIESFAMTAAIGSDNYLMQYEMEKALLNLTHSSNKPMFMDILYNAYQNDEEAYEFIYEDMLSRGVTEKQIQDAIEERMKKAQGVRFVEDLNQRYLTPKQQAAYDRQMDVLTQTILWSTATAKQKKDVQADLYNLLVGNKTGEELKSKITAGAGYGVDQTDFLLYQLSLAQHDRPTDSGKYGSYTQEEAEAALRAISSLNDNERGYLWQTTKSNWSEKNNPFW